MDRQERHKGLIQFSGADTVRNEAQGCVTDHKTNDKAKLGDKRKHSPLSAAALTPLKAQSYVL